MMNHGNYHEHCHEHHHGHHHGHHQVQPIVCPPQYCFHDEFTPREVPVIHPIVNVNRHHFVDIPRHYFTETTENVMGAPVFPRGGFGPQFGGGFGPEFGGEGRSPWM